MYCQYRFNRDPKKTPCDVLFLEEPKISDIIERRSTVENDDKVWPASDYVVADGVTFSATELRFAYEAICEAFISRGTQASRVGKLSWFEQVCGGSVRRSLGLVLVALGSVGLKVSLIALIKGGRALSDRKGPLVLQTVDKMLWRQEVARLSAELKIYALIDAILCGESDRFLPHHPYIPNLFQIAIDSNCALNIPWKLCKNIDELAPTQLGDEFAEMPLVLNISRFKVPNVTPVTTKALINQFVLHDLLQWADTDSSAVVVFPGRLSGLLALCREPAYIENAAQAIVLPPSSSGGDAGNPNVRYAVSWKAEHLIQRTNRTLDFLEAVAHPEIVQKIRNSGPDNAPSLPDDEVGPKLSYLLFTSMEARWSGLERKNLIEGGPGWNNIISRRKDLELSINTLNSFLTY